MDCPLGQKKVAVIGRGCQLCNECDFECHFVFVFLIVVVFFNFRLLVITAQPVMRHPQNLTLESQLGS